MTEKLALGLDGLDVESLDLLPADGSMGAMTAGHGITEVGASCWSIRPEACACACLTSISF